MIFEPMYSIHSYNFMLHYITTAEDEQQYGSQEESVSIHEIDGLSVTFDLAMSLRCAFYANSFRN